MRKFMLSIAALGPLAIIAGLALPVAAETVGEPTASQPAGEALNLDAIPVKPITGPQSIKGVAIDDEDDDMPGVGEGRSDHEAVSLRDDDGLASEDRDGEDD